MRRLEPRHRAGHQHGMTLVELIVAVFILGIVGAISLAAFTSGGQTFGRTDDDVRGQQDIKTVTERLTRDLRGARGIAAGATASKLVIWVDYNASYTVNIGETITWDVAASTLDPGHFDVRRTVGSGTPAVVGSSVIDAFAFKYFANAGTTPLPAASVQTAGLVEVTLKYDAILGAYLAQKLNIYQVRLRNAE